MSTATVYTGLSILALPGQPEVPDYEAAALADSWSLQLTEVASVANVTATTPVSDTWTLAFDDTHHGEPLSIPTWVTDLSVLVLPGSPDALTAKWQAPLFPTSLTDTFSLQWTESPVDTVQIDSWDVWQLTYAVESRALSISQSYPASEFWTLSWVENSTLTVTNAELDLAANDPWGVRWNDASGMWKDIPQLIDTWSISFAESLLLFNAPAASDTWSLTYSPDSSAVVAGGAFTTDVTDTWSLHATDVSGVVQALYPSVTDTWPLTEAEVSSVSTAGDMPIADTWALQWTETPADVQPTPMWSDLADTWSVQHQLEVGSVSNIPVIPVIPSDQWTLTFVESSSKHTALIQPPAERRLRVGSTRRVIKVK